MENNFKNMKAEEILDGPKETEFKRCKRLKSKFLECPIEEINIKVHKEGLDILKEKIKKSNIPNLTLDWVIDDLIIRDAQGQIGNR